MASTFIDTTTASAIIGTMFDNMTVRELRPNYVFDALSQEKIWNLSSPPKKGDTMSFPLLSSLTANTAALDATNDAIGTGAETLTYTRRNVSLALYGDHAVVDVLGLEPQAFADAVADTGWAIRDQGLKSINKLSRNVMDLNKYSNEASGTISSTYHSYGSSGTASSIGSLKSVDVRRVHSHLKSNNVSPWPDGYYRWIVDPKGATQLRAETGNAAWRAFQNASPNAEDGVTPGAVGYYEGFLFIVDNECLGAGTGTITSYAMGREAVGKAVGKDLSIVPNKNLRGVHENLLILRWEALIGYKVIRRVALHTVEHNNDSL